MNPLCLENLKKIDKFKKLIIKQKHYDKKGVDRKNYYSGKY
ncbi:hypothetical protein SAMN05444411_10694 [Lutibacter oricola]|uniref:Uncharacterized protein n=1 Tax=Lutibacter oricola TaxID=762486 RepID=A0A1H3C8V5_9FLAO|nr:hypothetical protein SAMN05444411_10694 [Lutibacter oricola]